jgi:hypothetical protein
MRRPVPAMSNDLNDFDHSEEMKGGECVCTAVAVD